MTSAAARRVAMGYRDRRRQQAGAATGPALDLGLFAFLALHLAMGPIFYQIRQIAVLHGVVVSGVAVWFAISRNRSLESVACVGAYITGTEILWRVTRVTGPVLFYEYSKYLLCGLFILALAVRGRFGVRGQLPAIGYFALLLPSALIPLTELDFSLAREDLSFNLSGPLTLMISALFFSQIDQAKLDRRRFLLALIAPVLSVAAVTVMMLLINDIDFGSAGSNKTLSGNFGPNQVSAMLGLAGLCAFLCVLEDKATRGFRVFMFAVMTFTLVQSALTFSRGGLYTFAGAAIVAALCMMRDRRQVIRVAVLGAVLFVVADWVVIPRLDTLTGGTLTARFQDTRLSGRDELIQSEVEIWFENPIFGVGPGQAIYHRDVSVVWAGAHTEFSRVLAEHGIFGAGSLCLLGFMILRTFRSGATPGQRALALAGLVWSFLFMSSAGMRVIAPAFMVGLSAAVQGRVAPLRRHSLERFYFRQAPTQPPVRLART